jgi:3-deoxy-D-manno-octulosonate 8-phosphate phosphatase (KDO 8-P phosphatase)
MNLLEKFSKIKCLAFDIDGVLTDGSLLILDDGQMVRKMNIKDGYALQLAVKKGYLVAIISGGDCEPVKRRLAGLGVTDVFIKAGDKKQLLQQYLQDKAITREQVLFMGDDIPDYEVMQEVGLPCCPADAVAEIKSIAAYISSVNGGFGCVRDVIEKVLKQQNAWDRSAAITSK